MKYTLDRFEGEFALLEREDRTVLSVPRKSLPETATEGNVLTCENETWLLAPEETRQAADRIRRKMENLWK